MANIYSQRGRRYAQVNGISAAQNPSRMVPVSKAQEAISIFSIECVSNPKWSCCGVLQSHFGFL
jgi:hypothetical protein